MEHGRLDIRSYPISSGPDAGKYPYFSFIDLYCDEGYYVEYRFRRTHASFRCQKNGAWTNCLQCKSYSMQCTLPPHLKTTAAPSGDIAYQNFYIITSNYWKTGTNGV